MGFCVLDTIAVVARHIQNSYESINRVLIFDFDVHHGNGTQDTFYDDDNVMFISIHQERTYPGTGPITEVGIGKGEGNVRQHKVACLYDFFIL